MTDPIPGRRARFAPPSLATACVALFGVVLFAWTIAAAVAYQRLGTAGVQATGLAALACWTAATAALLLAGSLRDTKHAISGILGGTLVRLFFPLAVAVAGSWAWPELTDAGLVGDIVIFFLISLGAETLLLLSLLRFGFAAPGRKFSSKVT